MSDVGVVIPPSQNMKLDINYRNTKQIVAFARRLLEGVEVTENSTLPDVCEALQTPSPRSFDRL